MNQSEFSTKSREDYASREIQTFGGGCEVLHKTLPNMLHKQV